MPVAAFRPLALHDIRESYAYLKANAGAGTAARFVDSVQASGDFLAKFPEIGSICSYSDPELKGLRRWPVKEFRRWYLFYFPGEQGVDVVRVLHSARDLELLFADGDGQGPV
jgi:toxin ParE1/3/4